MRPVRMTTDVGALLREMVAMYTQDIIELERKNIKLENKINRMKSGSKKAFGNLKSEKKDVERKLKDAHDNIRKIEADNTSLKIGIAHRDEIINYIFENTEDRDIKEYLQKTGIPNDF